MLTRAFSLYIPPSLTSFSLFGPTVLGEKFALRKMAAQTATRRKLNEHEEKRSSRNGLTYHDDFLANGHAGLQSNGHVQFAEKEMKPEPAKSRSKESFERVPFITAALTHLGFYILMFLGYMNQLFFTPKVAKEYNREINYAPCSIKDRVVGKVELSTM